jgi:hypothetical protein
MVILRTWAASGIISFVCVGRRGCREFHLLAFWFLNP